MQLHHQDPDLKICFTRLTSTIPRTSPAHEEQNEGDEADDADDHGDPHEDGGGPEGGGEDGPEVVQSAPADLSTVLAEMLSFIKWSAQTSRQFL